MVIPAMLRFRQDLLRWGPRIIRVGHLTGLTSENAGEGGAFLLVATWKGGKFEQLYTRQHVLGIHASKPPMQQRPHRRVCWFRDEFVRQVLEARGI